MIDELCRRIEPPLKIAWAKSNPPDFDDLSLWTSDEAKGDGGCFERG